MTPLRSVGIRFSSEEPDRPCLRVQGRSNFPLMQFGSNTSLASPRTLDYVPPPPPLPRLARALGGARYRARTEPSRYSFYSHSSSRYLRHATLSPAGSEQSPSPRRLKQTHPSREANNTHTSDPVESSKISGSARWRLPDGASRC